MGAKLGAKQLMEKAGVPVLPGGEVTGDTDLGELVRRVGLPLLIKASFGGGGRGMRLVRDRADLAGAVASARREATAAFGDGTVFAERYVTAEASARLARVLDRTQVHGVVTNAGLLAAILREPDFLAGRTDTGYLTRHDPAVLGAPDPAAAARYALAAALAAQAGRRAAAPVLAGLPSGWRNVRSADQHAEYETRGRRLRVEYRIGGLADDLRPGSPGSARPSGASGLSSASSPPSPNAG